MLEGLSFQKVSHMIGQLLLASAPRSTKPRSLACAAGPLGCALCFEGLSFQKVFHMIDQLLPASAPMSTKPRIPCTFKHALVMVWTILHSLGNSDPQAHSAPKGASCTCKGTWFGQPGGRGRQKLAIHMGNFWETQTLKHIAHPRGRSSTSNGAHWAPS